MTLNKKNIVTIILFAGLLVPFILITDIFPFMRFGMFAEPIKEEIQKEQFIVYRTDSTGNTNILKPEEIGINPNTFYYLCRNYIYRKEAKEFAEKIFSATGPAVVELKISHLISKKNAPASDTILIGKYSRNE